MLVLPPAPAGCSTASALWALTSCTAHRRCRLGTSHQGHPLSGIACAVIKSFPVPSYRDNPPLKHLPGWIVCHFFSFSPPAGSQNRGRLSIFCIDFKLSSILSDESGATCLKLGVINEKIHDLLILHQPIYIYGGISVSVRILSVSLCLAPPLAGTPPWS